MFWEFTLFPYYFNVSFGYFGFVLVFRFRFGKSGHPAKLYKKLTGIAMSAPCLKVHILFR